MCAMKLSKPVERNMLLSTKMHLRRSYEMLLCLSGYNSDILQSHMPLVKI